MQRHTGHVRSVETLRRPQLPDGVSPLPPSDPRAEGLVPADNSVLVSHYIAMHAGLGGGPEGDASGGVGAGARVRAARYVRGESLSPFANAPAAFVRVHSNVRSQAEPEKSGKSLFPIRPSFTLDILHRAVSPFPHLPHRPPRASRSDSLFAPFSSTFLFTYNKRSGWGGRGLQEDELEGAGRGRGAKEDSGASKNLTNAISDAKKPLSSVLLLCATLPLLTSTLPATLPRATTVGPAGCEARRENGRTEAEGRWPTRAR